MKKLFSLSFFLLLSLISLTSFSQRVSQYRMETYLATFSTIDTITGVPLKYTDINFGYAQFTLPFAVHYDSMEVAGGTRVTLSANGALSLTPGIIDPNGNALGDSNYPGSLCIFSGDMASGDKGVNWDAYKVDGSAPNRILTVQYHGIHFAGAGGGGGNPPKTAMQYKIYETSGIIEFLYQNHNFSLGTAGPTGNVGLNGLSPYAFSVNVYGKNLALTPPTDIRWIPKTIVFAGRRGDTATVGKQTCFTDTIRNIGKSDITINPLTLSSGIFSTSLTAPVTITAGLSVPITLCFTPQSTAAYRDSIQYQWSFYGNTFHDTIPLMGVGQQGCLTAPAGLTIGGSTGTPIGRTDTACITISNCGTQPASYVTKLDTKFDKSIRTIGDWSTVTMAPGDSRTLCVEYTPDSLTFTPAVILISQGDTIAAQSIAINAFGTGVNVTGMSTTASTKVGECDTLFDTLVNTGNAIWNPGAPTVQSLDNAFHFIGNAPGSIAAGDTAILQFEFCPVKAGSQTATITFPLSNPAPINGLPLTLHATATEPPPPKSVPNVTEIGGFALGAAYPNPVREIATAIIQLPTQANVQIDIIDERGAIVAHSFSGVMQKGEHAISLDLLTLPHGTYYYVLSSGNIRLARQIVK